MLTCFADNFLLQRIGEGTRGSANFDRNSQQRRVDKMENIETPGRNDRAMLEFLV